MEEVHKAISRHSQTQHEEVRYFAQLDAMREEKIEEAIVKCEKQEPFTVTEINELSKKMNALARKVNLPPRRLITVEMVREFVETRK
ncbi:DUF2533 family protein [Metabacillus sp. 84]|uniref:DUF2533 family protein n=1 Tax=unclassified Metabacillus TaxID=2675274 RepID=UPI003CF13C41